MHILLLLISWRRDVVTVTQLVLTCSWYREAMLLFTKLQCGLNRQTHLECESLNKPRKFVSEKKPCMQIHSMSGTFTPSWVLNIPALYIAISIPFPYYSPEPCAFLNVVIKKIKIISQINSSANSVIYFGLCMLYKWF